MRIPARPPPLEPYNPISTPLALFMFVDWKRELLRSCPGPSKLDVADMGDDLLSALFEDRCQPSLPALLDYAMAGLSAGQA
jgi:hypothetical protein